MLVNGGGAREIRGNQHQRQSDEFLIEDLNFYNAGVLNWSLLQGLYSQYAANPAAFDAHFEARSAHFGSYEAAFLEIFDGAVNLNTTLPGDPHAIPLMHDATGHVTALPCQ